LFELGSGSQRCPFILLIRKLEKEGTTRLSQRTSKLIDQKLYFTVSKI